MMAAEILRRSGVQFMLSTGQNGPQLILEACPFCGHRRKLWINAEHGGWICYHAACGRKGNLAELAAKFGQALPVAAASAFGPRPATKPPICFDAKAASSALLADDLAMAYLTERGLANPDLIRGLGIGLHVHAGAKHVALPRWRDGKVASVKLRAVGSAVAHDDRFRCIGSSAAGLFNAGALVGQKWAILCEGEINAASWVAAGVSNAVSVGAASPQGAAPEEIVALSKLDYVVLNYDQDEAGRAALAELIRRLGPDRCRVLDFDREWETKDANAVLVGMGAEALRGCVTTAKPCEIDGVKHVGEILRGMIERMRREREEPQTADLAVPWSNARQFLRLGYGHLVVFVGHPKTGKTTAALQVAFTNAIAGRPSVFWCLEMPPTEIVKRIAAQHFEKPWGEINDVQMDLLCDFLDDKPLYLGFGALRSPEEAYRQMRAAGRVFGAKLMVLDNLHYLSRGEENEHAILASATKYLKELAMELDLCVLLIAQPRMEDTSKMLGLYAARGTAAVASDCDSLVVLTRSTRQRDVDQAVDRARAGPPAVQPSVPTVLSVVASRYGPPGEVLLYYRAGEERFTETA